MASAEVLERILQTWRARWLAEEETCVEDLCRESPELLPDLKERIAEIKLLDALIGEFEERRERGENPKPEEVCREHPKLLERLKAEVAKLALFDSVFGETVDDKAESQIEVGPFCGGRYRVESVLNQGGQGIIYLAQDQELGRTVVVKGPGRRGLGREALGRLEQEAHTTGRLEHPGVVPVYGFGRNAKGQPYYAMKFIDGETLSAAIKRFHAPGEKATAAPSDARERTVQFQKLLRDFVVVCQTVAYAHSRGIVHRDIKPLNIMLGKFGEVWVVDWGLAKRPNDASNDQREDSSLPAVLARRGHWRSQTSVKGTLMYMSPEQAEGLSTVGPASDIYSLGATLYELLTGRPPIVGGTGQAILDRVKAGDIQPCREAKPDVSPALEAICLKALRLEPEERYASAAELASDIERWLADEPVAAWTEPWTDKAARWIRTHRTLVTGAVAALLVGAIGLGLLAAQQAEFADDLGKKNVIVEALNENLGKKNVELTKSKEVAEAKERAERTAKEEARKLLYYARIALARSEWQAANIRRTKQVLVSCDPDLRGWEWRFLDRLCHAAAKELDAAGKTTCLARSQAGEVIAAGREDGIVAVWSDPKTGGKPKEYAFLPDTPPGKKPLEVVAVAVSPDGKLIAAASRLKTDAVAVTAQPEVCVWNAATGELVLTLPASVGGLAFSPDSKLLALGSEGAVELVQVATWRKERTLRTDRQAPIAGVVFSRDGQSLAAAGRFGSIQVWNLNADADEAQEFSLDASDHVHCLAMSADGGWLAAGNASGGIDVWNLAALRTKDASMRNRLTILAHSAPVRSLAFHPELPLLASGSSDRTIKTWTVETERLSQTLRGHEEDVVGVLFAPNGKEIMTCGKDRSVKFWDPLLGEDSLPLPGQAFAGRGQGPLVTTWLPTKYPFSPGAKNVWVWDRASGKEIRPFAEHESAVRCAAVSKNGKIVATGEAGLSNGKTIVWELETGKVLWAFPSKTGNIHRVAISPDQRHLAVASQGDVTTETPGVIDLWDLETGKHLRVVDELANDATSLAFSPDNKLLVAATLHGPVKLFDAQTFKEVLVLKDHAYTSAAFSPDSQLLIATGGDEEQGGKAWVYRVATGKLEYELSGHSHTITTAAFSGDGARIATGSEDGTVRIWDPAIRQELLSLPHARRVNRVEFVGDDLVSSSETGTRIWKAPQPPPARLP